MAISVCPRAAAIMEDDYLVLNPLYLTLLGLQLVGLWKSPDDRGEHRGGTSLRLGNSAVTPRTGFKDDFAEK